MITSSSASGCSPSHIFKNDRSTQASSIKEKAEAYPMLHLIHPLSEWNLGCDHHNKSTTPLKDV